MKKAIVILAAAMSMVCCNKPKGTETGTAAADSAQVSAKAATTKMTDSTGKIPELEREKSQRKDDFEKSLPKGDSTISLKTVENIQEPKDTLAKKPATPTVKVVVAPEKIIREKRTVYRAAPKTTTATSRSADMEFSAEDLQTALQNLRKTAENYGAAIITEKQDFNGDVRMISANISVPSTEFSGFANALEFGKIGTLVSKNIQYNGSSANARISLIITSKENSSATGFGGRTLAAISAGGEAIGNIFLFVLPLWPLFLIAGAAFYLVKKKKKTP